MAAEPDNTQLRLPVTKERVFRAAIAVADDGGIDSLTMRKVADELGIEPMSLYYHVANKAAMLDGVVESLVAEIEDTVERLDPLADPTDWKAALRRRILTARSVMLRHRWAPALFESRTDVGPAAMRYYDGVLGHLRQGDFPFDLAHHALHVLGSRALGFTQELFEPEDGQADEVDTAALEQMADQLPNITQMLKEIAGGDPASVHGPDFTTLGYCDDQAEFEFALDLILDGLDRLRGTA
jgi:AcrR family transcriptional regulator